MSHNITVEGGSSVRLPTAGKYCDRDIVVTALGGAEDLNAELTEQESLIEQLGTILDNIVIPDEPVIEPLEVTENGTYTAPDGVDGYAPVVVNVPTSGGGGGASVTKKDVNFYDYDGTLLHSYTVAEAQALTELPALPEQSGLICQGWNWSLEDIKAHNRAVDVGAMYTTDDGTTRIYITLQEGRTSPCLGVCPNGTVTVDWGDGTAPDVLTGTNTSTVKWTPNHEYATPGDYVIRLTVDGKFLFRGTSSDAYILRNAASTTKDNRNYSYRNSIRKIQLGDNVTLGSSAFENCQNITSISIPKSIDGIQSSAMKKCYSLPYITLPDNLTSLPASLFEGCYSLKFASIPYGVTSIGSAFFSCYALQSLTLPNSLTKINGSMCKECYSLTSIYIPSSVTSINSSSFYSCYSLVSANIPSGVTSINSETFYNCYSLASATVPNTVTSIAASAFYFCFSARFFDFSSHTSVPTLSATSAFSSIPSDCEIRVPAALYDEWIAATNWSTYASKIVAV